MRKKSFTLSIGMLIVYVFFSAVIIVLAAILIGRSFKDPTLKYYQGAYNYNVNDLCEVVGMADYVFAARVVMKNKTTYNALTATKIGGIHTEGFPITSYTVVVERNIKGALLTEQEIIIYKDGGISKNGNNIMLATDDILPEPGKTYIFSAFTQPNGDLLIAGSRSTVEYRYSKYLEFLDAYLRRVEFERERFVSPYAVNKK